MSTTIRTMSVERKSSSTQTPIILMTGAADHPSDVISEVNGDFGRWQLRTILLIFLCKLPAAWFMACIVFTAPAPKPETFYCKQSDVLNGTQTLINTHHSHLESRTDREFKIDVCIANVRESENAAGVDPMSNMSKVVPCSKFEFMTEYNSLITDFDLVCSRKLLISVTQSFHALGTLIGGVIAKNLLTRFSPKNVMMFGMFAQVFTGNLTGFVTSFGLHIFFRTITALFCAFMLTSGQTIIVDITSGKARTIIVTLFELYWSIGLILLPGISIFVDSWTYLYVSISSPTILLLFLCRWITDSPRWLIRNGKVNETLEVLLESATYNDRKIPLDLEERLIKHQAELMANKAAHYFEIWDGTIKRSQVVAVHWAWVWSVVLYNAMILNIRAFGVDHLHANTVILGFAEMLGILIGLMLILYTRRHWFWSGTMISAAGIFTLFIWLVPTTIKESRRIGIDMIFCVGLKIANAVSMAILTTCTGEMTDLHKRPMLMYSVITFSRLWLMIGPFILALTIIHHLIPITVFAVLSILTGLFMIYLNMSFWDDKQPKVYGVPSVEMYKRTSQIIARKISLIEQKSPLDVELPKVSITDFLSASPKFDGCNGLNEVSTNFDYHSAECDNHDDAIQCRQKHGYV